MDLGEHRLKDLTVPQRLYQLVGPGLASDFAALKTLENRPTNLPTQPTALIGRRRELLELQALLMRADVRLLTLTGPGGTGKTRLALQLAADLLERFPHGVWFVNLAALNDSALVLPAVAQTLAVEEESGRPLAETLAEQLAGKESLLVLDNFEQVADAAESLAALLGRTGAIKVLVTSRASLNVRAEHEYGVPALLDDEALALFAERARASRPTFSIDGNRHVVAEICRRLDHLPLAIELAAARIKLLPERALLERLDERLKVLTGGARDLPARQQTLRAAIDWSFDLLSADEQSLFRRLSAFAGGRTLEAIEAVCNPDSVLDVLEIVASLVDKSLLRQEESETGHPRFVMLETIHEYARERLLESGEAAEVRQRHAHHFLRVAETANADRELLWAALSSIEVEHANFRAALEWSQTEAPALATELASRLFAFWDRRGHVSEGLAWLEQLAGVAEVPPVVRARALLGLGWLRWSAGRLDDAAAALEAAIEISVSDDHEELVRAVSCYGAVLLQLNRLDEASVVLKRALSLSRRRGSMIDIAINVGNLGFLELHRGNLREARSAFVEALEIDQRLDARDGIAADYTNLGIVDLGLGRYAERPR